MPGISKEEDRPSGRGTETHKDEGHRPREREMGTQREGGRNSERGGQELREREIGTQREGDTDQERETGTQKEGDRNSERGGQGPREREIGTQREGDRDPERAEAEVWGIDNPGLHSQAATVCHALPARGVRTDP